MSQQCHLIEYDRLLNHTEYMPILSPTDHTAAITLP